MSEYILDLRKTVGHRPLLQVGASVIVVDSEGRILLQKRRDNGLWGSFLCPSPSSESKLIDRIATDIPYNSCFLRMFVPKFNFASLHGIISI